MSMSIDTFNCFFDKLGEKYSFKKKLESQCDITPSSKEYVNEVIQALMAWENDPLIQDLAQSVAGEDGLMEPFDQCSRWMWPMSDLLEPDTVVISEASLHEKSTIYQATIQNIITSPLLHTGANISVIPEKFFRSLPQTPQLLKVHIHKVTSASGANLGPIGQCDLTFRLAKKQCIGRFMILQELCRNIILGLNWQCNYRIGCNWNINGQQYITHNTKFLYTSIPSSYTKPIFKIQGQSCCHQEVYQSYQ